MQRDRIGPQQDDIWWRPRENETERASQKTMMLWGEPLLTNFSFRPINNQVMPFLARLRKAKWRLSGLKQRLAQEAERRLVGFAHLNRRHVVWPIFTPETTRCLPPGNLNKPTLVSD